MTITERVNRLCKSNDGSDRKSKYIICIYNWPDPTTIEHLFYGKIINLIIIFNEIQSKDAMLNTEHLATATSWPAIIYFKYKCYQSEADIMIDIVIAINERRNNQTDENKVEPVPFWDF